MIAEGRGVDLKLPLDLSEDPESGQLQLALEQPQIPITGYGLDLFGGRNAILRTPHLCGTYPTTAAFTPWDEALSTQTIRHNSSRSQADPAVVPALEKPRRSTSSSAPKRSSPTANRKPRRRSRSPTPKGRAFPNRKSSSAQPIPASM